MSTYKFKTTKIKGKDYVEVNERIKFFRLEKKYDGWAIQTEFPMLTSDEALCRCTITNSDGMVVAQGHVSRSKRLLTSSVRTSWIRQLRTSSRRPTSRKHSTLSSRSMVMLLLPSRRLGCKSLCDDSVSTAA